MFCRTRTPDTIVAMASILILGGVLPLAGALVSQYGFGLHPCDFCLYQRYPYVLLVLLGVLSLLLPRGSLRWRLLVALGFCALLATATLGIIHTGIEQQWLNYAGGCVSQSQPGASLADIRAAIAAAALVSCADATVLFLGLSMASWNVLWAILVAGVMALQARYERRRDANRY
jgi:disulfide bond formation protein DsbB